MKVKSRTALSGLAALLPLTLSAQSISWTGDATPDTDWATAGNWSSDPAVPTIANTVTIDAGHAFVTTTDAVADTLTIGDTATGALTVSASGVLSVSTQSILGYGVGSSGSATVTGGGAIWNTGNLVVGTFGQGTLTIANGGVVNSIDVDLANGNAGGAGATQGSVRVTGTGSTWNATGTSFKIGGYADEETYNTGTLTIADGGSVTVGTEIGTENENLGTLTIFNRGVLRIGETGTAGLGGTLIAAEIAFNDSGYIDDATTPSADAPKLEFNHTDNITIDARLSGDYGIITKTGSGTLTFTGNGVADAESANAFGGDIEISDGTVVLNVGGYWNGDGHFSVTGSDTVLRIAGGTTLLNDLHVTDGTVEVFGTLGHELSDSTFDGSSTVYVSGGALVAGAFTFQGDSLLELDTPSAASDGYFAFQNSSTLLLNAEGAMRDATLDLYGGVTVTLGADEALDNTDVAMIPLPIFDEESGDVIGATTPTINLNGYDVTFSGLYAQGGEVINNSANDSSVTFAVGCGCGGPYSAFFAAFSEQSTGKINVRVVGGAELVMGGNQTYTGSTVVDASGFYFLNVPDENNIPIPSVLTASPIILRNGGALGGDGTVNSVTIENGGYLAPGDFGTDLPFAGTLTTDSITITSDLDHLVAEHSGLIIDIYDADHLLAPGTGVDFLNILGDLDFSSDLNDTFTVYVRSLGDDSNNLALNFTGLGQSWQIASIGGTLSNFDPSRIFVDASLFNNAFGLWTITRGVLNDKELYLNFAPIPEPATFALLGSLGVLPALLRRRRR